MNFRQPFAALEDAARQDRALRLQEGVEKARFENWCTSRDDYRTLYAAPDAESEPLFSEVAQLEELVLPLAS